MKLNSFNNETLIFKTVANQSYLLLEDKEYIQVIAHTNEANNIDKIAIQMPETLILCNSLTDRITVNDIPLYKLIYFPLPFNEDFGFAEIRFNFMANTLYVDAGKYCFNITRDIEKTYNIHINTMTKKVNPKGGATKEYLVDYLWPTK